MNDKAENCTKKGALDYQKKSLRMLIILEAIRRRLLSRSRKEQQDELNAPTHCRQAKHYTIIKRGMGLKEVSPHSTSRAKTHRCAVLGRTGT